MADYVVETNVKITNYTPQPNRQSKSTDLNITNNEDNIVSINNHDKAYIDLLDKLKGLDGNNNSLSLDDLLKSKSLIGQVGIKDVKVDSSAKVARFIFTDDTDFRIDMGLNYKTAIQNIQDKIKKGEAYYDGGILNAVCQYLDNATKSRKNKRGDEIVLLNIPTNLKTLNDVKKYYNLPTGTLANNAENGGDAGLQPVPSDRTVRIHVKTLAKGLGMTQEQIEALFKEKNN